MHKNSAENTGCVQWLLQGVSGDYYRVWPVITTGCVWWLLQGVSSDYYRVCPVITTGCVQWLLQGVSGDYYRVCPVITTGCVRWWLQGVSGEFRCVFFCEDAKMSKISFSKFRQKWQNVVRQTDATARHSNDDREIIFNFVWYISIFCTNIF